MTTIISPALVSNTLEFPLNHARIGWENLASSVVATSEASGFPASIVLSATTYERWKPTAMPATLTFDLGSAQDVDYVGIASHSLGTQGSLITVESSTDNSTWSTVDSKYVQTDAPLMFLFEKTQAQYWRITVSDSPIPTIGVVYIGEALAMYRPFYSGHTPGQLNRQTDIRPNRSEEAEFLGRSIIRQGKAESYEWRHIPINWYIDNVEPMVKQLRKTPAFIAWNPLRFPTHVVYGWTTGDIAPTTMGIRDLVQFGLSVEALGDE